MNKFFIVALIPLFFFVNCSLIGSFSKSLSEITVSQNFHFNKYKRVTVFPFINNKPEKYNYHISDQLSTSLMKRGYTVIERTQLEALLRELNIELTGLINQNDMMRIGKLLKIDTIVMGSLEYDIAPGYAWWLKSGTMRMIDVTTGELIVSIYSYANNRDIHYVVTDIISLMDKEKLEQR